jgi:hypothetical protein
MLCASALGSTFKIDVAMNASSDADRNAHVRCCFFLAPNDKRSSPHLWESLIYLSFEDVIHKKINLHTYETRFYFVIIVNLLINSILPYQESNYLLMSKSDIMVSLLLSESKSFFIVALYLIVPFDPTTRPRYRTY